MVCVTNMRAPTSPQVCCSRRSDRGRHCNLTCRWSVAAAMTSTSPSMSMLLLVSSDACLCARSIPLHLPSRVSAHCAGTQAQPAPMRGSRGAGHRWTARDIANNDSNTLQHGRSPALCSTATSLPSPGPVRLADGFNWPHLRLCTAPCVPVGCFKRAWHAYPVVL
jgi:hypothetical protein